MTVLNKVETNPLEKSKVMYYINHAIDTYLEKKIRSMSEYSFNVAGVRDLFKEADEIKKHIEENLK